MPLLAIAIYLCFERPVTKALQVPLRNRLAALRQLSLGPTSPEGASKHGHMTRLRVAREHAAKTFALISPKPEGADPAILLNTIDRRQANGGDNKHFREKWTPVFRKEMRQTSNLQRFPSAKDAIDTQPKRKSL